METAKNNIIARALLTVAAVCLVSVLGLTAAGWFTAAPVYAAGFPNPPEKLMATPVSSSKITLQWQDKSDNEINFIIERKTGKGNFAHINTVGARVTSYTDTGLTTGIVYSYRVKAHGSAGDSPYSNVVSTTTLQPVAQAPKLQSPGNAFIVTNLTPTLRWVGSQNNVTYSLQVSSEYNFSKPVINETGIKNNYYIVSGEVFEYKKTYFWRVSVQDSAGTSSPWSTQWFFKVFPFSFGINYCNCR
jgi:hypothetical protein